MFKTVIHPLQSCDGIEGLRGSIDFTATELRTGSLRSVREVEVSLLSNGKVSTHPIMSSRYMLTNHSHPACPHRSIRDILMPLLLSVIALCTKQAPIGAIDVMPYIWTRSWLQLWRWILDSDSNRSYLAINAIPMSTPNLIPTRSTAENIRTPSSTETQTPIDSSPSTIISPTFTCRSSTRNSTQFNYIA